jgi:taurine dioxygenase
MQDVMDVVATPLSPACGAEISGVDLTRPLSPSTVAAIKDAWGRHLVLVFRGQTLTEEQQLRFASYFGDLGIRKKAPEPLRSRAEGIYQTNDKVLLVTNIKVDGQPIGAFGEGEFWFHIDSGYTARPYRYTFLYALELPSRGGNTMFSNMYKAYDAVLDRRLQEPPSLRRPGLPFRHQCGGAHASAHRERARPCRCLGTLRCARRNGEARALRAAR